MKATLIALWRLFHAVFFYPLMVGLFIWLYITSAHWAFGLVIILAILILDPIWRILAGNIWQLLRRPK